MIAVKVIATVGIFIWYFVSFIMLAFFTVDKVSALWK